MVNICIKGNVWGKDDITELVKQEVDKRFKQHQPNQTVINITNHHGNVTNNIQNNDNRNFIVNNFGMENVDHLLNYTVINHRLMRNCIRNPNPGLITIGKKIYMNPKYPGNRTVKITNLRTGHALVYKEANEMQRINLKQ